MGANRLYVINKLFDIRKINKDIIIVKKLYNRLKIEGFGISEIIVDIIKFFETPTSIDSVLVFYEKNYNYNIENLKELLDFLIKNNILIKEEEILKYNCYDRNFLEKNIIYLDRNTSLFELKDKLSSIKIGLIGTNELIKCILENFIKAELVNHFSIKLTDRPSGVKDEFNYLSSLRNLKVNLFYDLEDIIEKTDILIVCSNYPDHYLFNKINKLCLKRNKTWIRVMIDGNYGEIGPIFEPGKTSCYTCLTYRQKFNMEERDNIFYNLFNSYELHNSSKNKMVGLYSSYQLTALSASILCLEAMKYLTKNNSNLIGKVACLNSNDLSLRVETIFKDYTCDDCGN